MPRSAGRCYKKGFYSSDVTLELSVVSCCYLSGVFIMSFYRRRHCSPTSLHALFPDGCGTVPVPAPQRRIVHSHNAQIKLGIYLYGPFFSGISQVLWSGQHLDGLLIVWTLTACLCLLLLHKDVQPARPSKAQCVFLLILLPSSSSSPSPSSPSSSSPSSSRVSAACNTTTCPVATAISQAE